MAADILLHRNPDRNLPPFQLRSLIVMNPRYQARLTHPLTCLKRTVPIRASRIYFVYHVQSEFVTFYDHLLDLASKYLVIKIC